MTLNYLKGFGILDDKIILLGLKFSEIITVISISITFLALIVAPYINHRNSKRQTIAPMRQIWINTLRDKISEILAITSISRANYCPSSNWNEERKERADKRDLENYEKLMLLQSSLNLYINPKEDDHLKLIELISLVIKEYHDSTVSENNKSDLIELSQKVLKKEWEATKKT